MSGFLSHRRLLAVFWTGVVGAGIVPFGSAGASADPGPGGGTSTPSPIVYTTSQEPLLVTGVSDLSGYAGSGSSTTASAPKSASIAPGTASAKRVLPLSLPPRSAAPGASMAMNAAAASPGATGSSEPTQITPGTYPQTVGFQGINGQQDTAAEGYYLEPPDQGLCVGGQGGPNATVMEFINNTLQAFSPSGTPESQIIPAAQLFDQPADAALSDPRCYWDRDTRRWFMTEFTYGATSTQYIAVSQTANALGKYTVFQFDTTDPGAPPGYNCPCFGDFDQLGADSNGIYISTNEFPVFVGGFNGSDLWAMSKQNLVNAADFQATPPPVDRYAVTGDQFGLPYHVSPASTPPDGSYFPNTEFFVESNSDANADNHLLIYDMTNTQLLNRGGIPPLAASSETTEGYSFPPNAYQPPGICSLCTIEADFNAVQEVTETHGTLYAELDSGTAPYTQAFPGTGPAQAEWFILDPEQSNPQSVGLINQGIVGNPNDSILYPDIAVDGAGDGYLIFSTSGSDYYPSPGYVQFDKYRGPVGPALLPTTGANDEAGFSCYPPYGVPGDPVTDCRWGDYSMGVAYDNRIFMAAEYIPPPGTPGPAPVNWGTYIWSAPHR